jgi:BMFP domain-containing protein YqiC
MQTNNRILDDIAKVANSAVSTLVGVKSEAEAALQRQLVRLLNEMDLVPRDEFEAMKAVAITARTEQEKQEKRILALEAVIARRVKLKSTAKSSKSKD